MTYDEALAALRRALVFGTNPTLEGEIALCEELGRPQDAYATIQVTGTNGKTSTSRITAALLRAEGLRVGLYTSPELERYPERMEVDGEVVSDDDFALAVSTAIEAGERLRGVGSTGTEAGFTEFELLTAAALWLFRARGVDVAVLEVGLGGRWDATSVVNPRVAVITGVGLDHTHILGDTIEQIAAEKAAIIKPGAVAVLGPGAAPADAVFLAQAARVGAPVRVVREEGEATPVAEGDTVRYRVASRPAAPGDGVTVDVSGAQGRYGGLALRGPAYQAANVAAAAVAAEAAIGRALTPARARGALARLAIPGRFELLRAAPPLLVDAAHNPQAASVLADAVRAAFPDPATRPVVLLGVLGDKDAEGIAAALAPVAAGIAVTQSGSPRALPATALAGVVRRVTGAGPLGEYETVRDALADLAAGPLLVTGSITTAGEARGLLRSEHGILGG